VAGQLSMIRTHMRGIPRGGVPRGYYARRYRRVDAAAWIEIIGRTICEYTEERFLNELRNGPYFDAKRLFFIVHRRTGKPVATACAGWAKPGDCHHGYVHFLGVLPEHQGKGLGRAIMLIVLRSFARRGVRDAILQTDDFRLPALKIYLELGFIPRYMDGDRRDRWTAVFEQLGVPPVEGVEAQ